MRFAGTATNTDPSKMEYVGGRMAGELPKKNPKMVNRIATAIMPSASNVTYSGEYQAP